MMTGRMATFNQRVVKVVLPTLEAKADWAQAAARDGFEGNLSGWLRGVVALHVSSEASRLAEEAAQAKALAAKAAELEREIQMLRDAYEKARADFAGLSGRYEELASKHASWVAEQEAKRAAAMLEGKGALYWLEHPDELEALEQKTEKRKPAGRTPKPVVEWRLKKQ